MLQQKKNMHFNLILALNFCMPLKYVFIRGYQLVFNRLLK